MEMMEATDPFILFGLWFDAASAAEPEDPNAMTLGTATADGRVSIRVMLMKGFDRRGFVFYTNLVSRKAGELNQNRSAALCFHWKSLQRQVRIEGVVEPVSDDEADLYFLSRPRESQIGAWASRQSEVLQNRGQLDARFDEFDRRFRAAAVPRPEHWSGFRVIPGRVEFWHARPFRLHDRLLFTLDRGIWTRQLLYP